MIESTPEGVVITVRVIPRAARSGVAGTRDGALLVRLNAPPVDGAANAELIEVVAAARNPNLLADDGMAAVTAHHVIRLQYLPFA